MNALQRRLPHVVTRSDLALLLVPTYAEAQSVDDDEAHDRVTRALGHAEVLAGLYRGLEAALHDALGPKTSEDALVDKISARVANRRGRAKPAPSSPAISAVLVRMNLELGLAPEPMRVTLATVKGRALLDQGLHQLGTHLVKELLR